MIDTILRSVHQSRVGGALMRRASRCVGSNIFDEEWDVAIIIDAAYYEMVVGLEPEYEYLKEIDAIWSRGSKSSEWAQNTSVEDDVSLGDDSLSASEVRERRLTQIDGKLGNLGWE